MFFVFFDIHLASGLVAFLCGLLGSLISILALLILWLVPAIAPQSPRRLVDRLPQRQIVQQPNTPTPLLENRNIPIDRSASFTNLQDTVPQQSPPPSTRHVSFNFDRSKSSGADPGPHSLPNSPSFSPPIQRRWSSAVSPFYKRKPTSRGLLDTPPMHDLSLRSFDPNIESHSPVDELGLLTASPPHTPFSVSSQKSHTRRASTPLSHVRFSFAKQRGPSSVSTPTLVDESASSPGPSTSARRSFRPVYRAGFVNTLNKRFTSRARSQPTPQSPETSSSNTCIPTSDGSPLYSSATASSSHGVPMASRRKLVRKLTSIFKSSTDDFPRHVTELSPILPSKPIKTFSSRFRRKPVARTQPYGPPWNAPMPIPEPADTRIVSPRPLRETFDLPSSLPPRTRERSGKGSFQLLPGQLSPRTFINELDERLSLLQEQNQPTPLK